jgi:Cu(I)/Ag(I) efflux system membrane protein CusA/SilA
VLIGLIAEQQVRPISTEIRLPLDEGMVMDMPITVPRASISQSSDDLKARDMVLCRFPEVHMVVGKAGRAETPFDPAPLDMIETMIEFRPRAWWPKRRLPRTDADEHARAVWRRLLSDRLIRPSGDEAAHQRLVDDAVEAGLHKYDAVLREVCHLHVQRFFRALSVGLARRLIAEVGQEFELSDGAAAAIQQQLPPERVAELAWGPSPEILEPLAHEVLRLAAAGRTSGGERIDRGRLAANRLPGVQAAVEAEYERLWAGFVPQVNADVAARAPRLWTRIISEELLTRVELLDASLADVLRQGWAARYAEPPRQAHHGDADSQQHSMVGLSELPLIDPHREYDALLRDLSERLATSLRLEPHDPESLAGFGSEMDRALQMPGWTNVWTRPIQNRVDMLATGVNAEVGVRVLGRDLDAVVDVSEQISATLRDLPGAADVLADPVRGKGYLRVTPDSVRAAEAGVSMDDLNAVLEAALPGRLVTHELNGRERIAVRVGLRVLDAVDEETLRRLPVPVHAGDESLDGIRGLPLRTVPLDSVADVEVTEGPATIKSENAWLRNYVRLNVRDRDPAEFVDEARRVVAGQVELPAGVFVEWTGQYEHSARSRRRLLLLMPIVLASILLVLYATYRDWGDTLLVLIAIPGALAGGVVCQWLLGYRFSVAVGMGYIACFGMAAATGIVMLVYLREAVDRAGGLEQISEGQLREAVLTGAVHRLRPKLLTEATTVMALLPMLWSTGVGADVIRPMAAPVLGGILIADEVIDLLLPVLFYKVRLRRWRRLHARPSAPRHDQPLMAGFPSSH